MQSTQAGELLQPRPTKSHSPARPPARSLAATLPLRDGLWAIVWAPCSLVVLALRVRRHRRLLGELAEGQSVRYPVHPDAVEDDLELMPG